MSKKRQGERSQLDVAGEGRPVAWDVAIVGSPLALAVLDRDTFAIRGLSPAFQEVIGLAPAVLLGRPFPDLLPAAGVGRMRSILRSCRDTGSAARASGIGYIHPRHGPIALDCSAWTFPSAGNGGSALAVHVSGAADRVRERGRTSVLAGQIRAANEQLLIAGVRQLELAEQSRQHARRINELLASQAGGVLVISRKGDVVLLNAPARQMLGLPDPADPIFPDRLRALDLRRPDGSALPATERPIERLLRGEQFSDLELGLVRADGESLRITFNGSAIEDTDASGVSLAILVFYEVTAKRRLDDLRADYIALIAHDLRAPLNTILGYAELVRLLLQTDTTGRGGNWVDRINQAAWQMAAMIDDLVESTRLEAGALKLDLEPADLLATVQGAVLQLPSPEERDRISVDAPAEALPVSVDQARFARVVTNLISNALKYSPPGSPVTVRIRQDAAEVTLAVTDHGRGLPPESLGKLFQRFYRVDPASPIAGMGLGLYIARLIVEAHGGRIRAESQPGQGSTFSVTLPLA